MPGAGRTDVNAAFDMLLEEVDAEVAAIRQQGASCFQQGDYEGVRRAASRAEKMAEMKGRLASLREEWSSLATAKPRVRTRPTESPTPTTRLRTRVPRGLKVREEAYYRPILQALVEMGGAAEVKRVLSRVEGLMKVVLKEYDYQPIPSDADMPRWYNTAQWARRSMIKKGLMKADSQWGIWEISDDGRRCLAAGGTASGPA